MSLETAEGVHQCAVREAIEDCHMQDDDDDSQDDCTEQLLQPVGTQWGKADKYVESRALTIKDNVALLQVFDEASLSLSNQFRWLIRSERVEVRGTVEDELEHYTNASTIDTIPAVSFALSGQQAMEVEKFIIKHTEACHTEQPDCTYQLLGHNCMDFSQAVFEQTPYPGHFIGYFPANAHTPAKHTPVSYTHLTLPTNREV